MKTLLIAAAAVATMGSVAMADVYAGAEYNKTEASGNGVSVSADGFRLYSGTTFEVTPGFTLKGEVGYYKYDGSINSQVQATNSDFDWSVGADFDVTTNTVAYVSYKSTAVSSATVADITIGVRYNF